MPKQLRRPDRIVSSRTLPVPKGVPAAELSDAIAHAAHECLRDLAAALGRHHVVETTSVTPLKSGRERVLHVLVVGRRAAGPGPGPGDDAPWWAKN